MPEVVVADGVLFLWKGSAWLAAALSAILVQRRGGRGAVRHRRMRQVRYRREAGHLPVGWQTVALERGEHLQAAVFAVAGLQTMPQTGRKRSEVVLKRGCLRTPGGPQRSVEVPELSDGREAPLLLVDLAVVRLRVVAKTDAHQASARVVRPRVERAGEDQPVALIVAAHLHTPVAA